MNNPIITIQRTFNAPRQLVWDVWTKPEHVAHWFGPKGFTTRVEKLDFRVGGASRYVMIGPDGTEYPAEGVFTEIIIPERIVTTDEFGDDYIEQNPDFDFPKILSQTYLFKDLGKKTELSIIIAHPTEEDKQKHMAMGVEDGWGTSLDKMADYLNQLK